MRRRPLAALVGTAAVFVHQPLVAEDEVAGDLVEGRIGYVLLAGDLRVGHRDLVLAGLALVKKARLQRRAIARPVAALTIEQPPAGLGLVAKAVVPPWARPVTAADVAFAGPNPLIGPQRRFLHTAGLAVEQ